MDRLGTCIDALRILARSNDADRAVLVERYIDAYLATETVSAWHALKTFLIDQHISEWMRATGNCLLI